MNILYFSCMIKNDPILSFHKALRRLIFQALRLSLRNPGQGYFFLRTLLRQKKLERLRISWAGKGVCVPAILIASITEQCNLRCTGCYARAKRPKNQKEMGSEEWRRVLCQARDLGVSFVLFSGGEPFLRKDIMALVPLFPEMVFVVFTNGLLLREGAIAGLKKQRNLVLVLSLEGFEKRTDERRGRGVYTRIMSLMEKMKKAGLFFGVSITLTRKNFQEALDERLIASLGRNNPSLFLFVEYTPVERGTEGLILLKKQRKEMMKRIASFSRTFPGIYEVFPGDEKRYGGCLAAGRGFIHVNSRGSLEPCPFAPFSDVNLREKSLEEALKSHFLKAIRDHHDHLTEKQGGCSLWNNRVWVRSFLNS